MSASARSVEPCPECGGVLPRGARCCPACGSDLGAAGVPPQESRVAYARTQPRRPGLSAPLVAFGLVVLLVVGAIVLFAGGAWAYGLILLGAAALAVAGLLDAAQRSAVGSPRRSSRARERARAALETWRVRLSATAATQRARSALALLESERQGSLLALGRAAYARDEAAEADARTRLVGLDAREAELRQGLDRALGRAAEQIREARLPVEDTILLRAAEPPPAPGEDDPAAGRT